MSAVFAHDALLVAGMAVDTVLKKFGADLFSSTFAQHQLYNAGQPGIQCRLGQQHTNPQLVPFEFGDMIVEAIKEVSFYLR